MLQGIPQLHLPDVCTESPIRGRAFCSSHCKFIEENYAHVPTGLKEFLKYCGIIPAFLEYTNYRVLYQYVQHLNAFKSPRLLKQMKLLMCYLVLIILEFWRQVLKVTA